MVASAQEPLCGSTEGKAWRVFSGYMLRFVMLHPVDPQILLVLLYLAVNRHRLLYCILWIHRPSARP
eukprot:1133519-Pelagomonas_calceolata.AAC.10